MDKALEQRAYKVECNTAEKLRAMSEDIGFLNSGPRDVVEIHTVSLRRNTHEALSKKAQAYAGEGRLMIQLMGYLVLFSRTQALQQTV